jgi:hypothetical protein
MTDQDPYGDPTRVDTPVTDPTQAMPAAAGGPPTGGPPPPTSGPPDEPGGRRGWILAGVFALVLLIGLAILLLSDDDETTTDTTTTSTTLEETTTTASTTTTEGPTTTESTTTTEATPATVAPGLCTSGPPDDPGQSVQVLYQAYTLDDRECADQLGTEDAVDALFAIPGDGQGWEFQGCTDQDEPDPHTDCAFTFTGGATHFRTNYSDTDGWVVFEVFQTAD